MNLLRQWPKGWPPILAPCFLSLCKRLQSHGPWLCHQGSEVLFSVDGDRLAQSSGHSPIITGPGAAGQATRGELLEGPGGSGGQNPGQNGKVGSLFRNNFRQQSIKPKRGLFWVWGPPCWCGRGTGGLPSAPFLLKEPQGRRAPHHRGHYFSSEFPRHRRRFGRPH